MLTGKLQVCAIMIRDKMNIAEIGGNKATMNTYCVRPTVSIPTSDFNSSNLEQITIE